MKKFYTAMAMLACVTAASAFTMENVKVAETAPQAINKVEFNAISGKKVMVNAEPVVFDLKANKAKVASRADEWNEVGTVNFDDQLLSGATLELELQVKANDPNYFRLVQPWAAFGIYGDDMEIDATNPELVKVPNFESGYEVEYADGEYSSVWFFSYSSYLADYGYTDEEIEAVFEEQGIESIVYYENQYIYFPAGSMLAQYPEYTDQLYYGNTADMYIFWPGMPVMWEDCDTEAQWTDGFASFNWIGVDPVTSTVTVQKNNYFEGTYRIVDPYAAAFAEGNYDISGNPLQFDMADPNCVIVPDQNAGFSTNLGTCYILSDSYYYVGWKGMSIEEYLALPETEGVEIMNITASTVDGLTTVNFPVDAILWYYTQDENGYLYFTDGNGNSSKLVFNATSGISSVVAEEAGEAVYYNLQGVRIANPQAGQIYIVKQGNKVSKQIMR